MLDDAPGIDIDLDEAAVAKFPYHPASLPVFAPDGRHDVSLVISGRASRSPPVLP